MDEVLCKLYELKGLLDYIYADYKDVIVKIDQNMLIAIGKVIVDCEDGIVYLSFNKTCPPGEVGIIVKTFMKFDNSIDLTEDHYIAVDGQVYFGDDATEQMLAECRDSDFKNDDLSGLCKFISWDHKE